MTTYLEHYRTQWIENAETGCWNWTGPVSSRGGYALTDIPTDNQQAAALAVYQLMRDGWDPDHDRVLRLCKNRKCVNPDHMLPTNAAGVSATNLRAAKKAKAANLLQPKPVATPDAMQVWRDNKVRAMLDAIETVCAGGMMTLEQAANYRTALMNGTHPYVRSLGAAK